MADEISHCHEGKLIELNAKLGVRDKQAPNDQCTCI